MDLFDSLDKIAPILVFFFWIIISILSQSRKNKQKKSKGKTSTTNANPQYRKPKPVPATTASQYKNQGNPQQQSTAFEDLKKKLETIFNESLPNDDVTLTEDEVNRYKNAVKQPQPAEVSAKPESVSLEEVLPEGVKKERKKWYSTETSDAYDQTRQSTDKTVPAIDLSLDKIREGFILSEILAPPVSLREDRC